MINGSLFHEAKEIERVQNYFQVTVNLKKLCRIVKPAWLSVVIYIIKPLTFSLESCGLDLARLSVGACQCDSHQCLMG